MESASSTESTDQQSISSSSYKLSRLTITQLTDTILNVKWKKFHKFLTRTIQQFKNTGKYMDVILQCDDGLCSANRLVLAARSPFFKSILTANAHKCCNLTTITMTGINKENMTNLLSFIYYGELSIQQDDVTVFLNTAKMLQLTGSNRLQINWMAMAKSLAVDKRKIQNSTEASTSQQCQPYNSQQIQFAMENMNLEADGRPSDNSAQVNTGVKRKNDETPRVQILEVINPATLHKESLTAPPLKMSRIPPLLGDNNQYTLPDFSGDVAAIVSTPYTVIKHFDLETEHVIVDDHDQSSSYQDYPINKDNINQITNSPIKNIQTSNLCDNSPNKQFPTISSFLLHNPPKMLKQDSASREFETNLLSVMPPSLPVPLSFAPTPLVPLTLPRTPSIVVTKPAEDIVSRANVECDINAETLDGLQNDSISYKILIYQCMICADVFLNDISFFNHIKKEHDGSDLIHRHHKVGISEELNSPLPGSSGKPTVADSHYAGNQTAETEKLKFKCAECEKIYETEFGIAKHLDHHIHFEYPCLICGTVYPAKFFLREHIIKEHPNIDANSVPRIGITNKLWSKLFDSTLSNKQSTLTNENIRASNRQYSSPSTSYASVPTYAHSSQQQYKQMHIGLFTEQVLEDLLKRYPQLANMCFLKKSDGNSNTVMLERNSNVFERWRQMLRPRAHSEETNSPGNTKDS